MQETREKIEKVPKVFIESRLVMKDNKLFCMTTGDCEICHLFPCRHVDLNNNSIKVFEVEKDYVTRN